MTAPKPKVLPIDWNDDNSVVTRWARLNVDSHIHGRIARWIVQASATIAQDRAALARVVEALKAAQEMEQMLSAAVSSASCETQDNESEPWERLVHGYWFDGMMASYSQQIEQAITDLPASAAAFLAEVEELRKALAETDAGYWNAAANVALKSKQIEDLTERAEKAEAEVSRLQSTQRTPGTVDVCRNWWHDRDFCPDDSRACSEAACPLRQQTGAG